MEAKKTHRADLEDKRGLFVQLGILTVLLLLFVAFEWSFADNSATDAGTIVSIDLELELISPVQYKPEIQPPKPKPQLFDISDRIVNETTTKSNDIEPFSSEFFEDEPVNWLPLKKETEEPAPYFFAEQMPEFPGGVETLKKFIARNLQYPPQAQEDNLQGRVYVRFLINAEGKVEQAKVLNSVHPLLDNEALRLIESLPDWKPGTQNGRKVAVWYTIPVSFVIR